MDADVLFIRFFAYGMPLLKELIENVLVIRKEIQRRINDFNF